MGLIDDAKAARDAHMTYGQYMNQKGASVPPIYSKRNCVNCGAPLLGRRAKYCSGECRKQMNTKTARGDYFV